MGLLRSASLLSAGPVRPDLPSPWGHVRFGGLAPLFHPNLRSRWPSWAFLGLSRPLEPLGQPTGRLVLAGSRKWTEGPRAGRFFGAPLVHQPRLEVAEVVPRLRA